MSLSTRFVIYKGLVLPKYLRLFYHDLSNPLFKSHFASIHSRYSTNTLAQWELAQPCQFLAHNGEINTLRGNINALKSVLPNYKSTLLSRLPLSLYDNDILSDSMWLNKWVEFLYYSGKTLPDIFSFLLPQSRAQSALMSAEVGSYYRYHAAQVDPWSGPAAIAFSDGLIAGACLDRFGLRPVRYQLFDDDYFVLASEIGVLDRANITIKKEGRLAPAEIFYVDLSTGHLHFDKHIKEKLAKNADYQKAVTKKHLPLPYYNSVKDINESEKDILKQVNPSLTYTMLHLDIIKIF